MKKPQQNEKNISINKTKNLRPYKVNKTADVQNISNFTSNIFEKIKSITSNIFISDKSNTRQKCNKFLVNHTAYYVVNKDSLKTQCSYLITSSNTLCNLYNFTTLYELSMQNKTIRNIYDTNNPKDKFRLLPFSKKMQIPHYKKYNVVENINLLSHLIYEYKKGVRGLVMYTTKTDQLNNIKEKLAKENLSYFIQYVSNDKVNVFIDKKISTTNKKNDKKSLSELASEEDFVLGILLGYTIEEQVKRYLANAILKRKRDQYISEVKYENKNI